MCFYHLKLIAMHGARSTLWLWLNISPSKSYLLETPCKLWWRSAGILIYYNAVQKSSQLWYTLEDFNIFYSCALWEGLEFWDEAAEQNQSKLSQRTSSTFTALFCVQKADNHCCWGTTHKHTIRYHMFMGLPPHIKRSAFRDDNVHTAWALILCYKIKNS